MKYIVTWNHYDFPSRMYKEGKKVKLPILFDLLKFVNIDNRLAKKNL